MKNKILFFDFNGVISYNNFWHDTYSPSHKLYKRHKEINDFVFNENIEMVMGWMVGKYTTEDIHDLIEKELDIEKEDLLPIFNNGAKNIDISSEILEKIQAKKEDGYKAALITDNMDSFPMYTRTNNKILDETFDAIYDSYTTGLLKKSNGGEIFKIMIQDLNGDLSESYLFDDSSSNCEVFSGLGGKVFNVSGIDNVLDALGKV